jgi:hypothetical protein
VKGACSDDWALEGIQYRNTASKFCQLPQLLSAKLQITVYRMISNIHDFKENTEIP